MHLLVKRNFDVIKMHGTTIKIKNPESPLKVQALHFPSTTQLCIST